MISIIIIIGYPSQKSPPYATVNLPKSHFRTSPFTNGSRYFPHFGEGVTHKVVTILMFILNLIGLGQLSLYMRHGPQ